MFRFFPRALLLGLALFLIGCPGQERAGEDGPDPGTPPISQLPTPDFCINGDTTQLCSKIPHDIVHQLSFDYKALTETDQFAFDNFSWQMFVALNWPADGQGNPLATTIGSAPSAPRVWEFYPTGDTVFGLLPDAPNCLAEAQASGKRVLRYDAKAAQVVEAMGLSDVEIKGFLEATGQPLIDRNLNFAVYSAALNQVEADYIINNGLTTKAGQQAFKDAGKTVSFPLGHYEDDKQKTGGSVGAMELKTAWRILDVSKGDDPSRFYTIEAKVVIDAENSDSGQSFCFDAQLGLVGFHIIQRTTNPDPQDWMWATFEHIDNAPQASNAADPADPTGPTTCDPPTESSGTTYSFFNAECGGCATNQPPQLLPGQKNFTWATSPPYAAKYAVEGKYGTQVVRCWQIYSETQYMNQQFQGKLEGTVWANYFLINTQWMAQAETNPPTTIAVPKFLGNTALETYIQPTSSCLTCHGQAKTTAGQDANYSFFLGLAQ